MSKLCHRFRSDDITYLIFFVESDIYYMNTPKGQNIRETRKQKVAEHLQDLKNRKPKVNWISIILSILFVFGVILVIFEIDIYRETIIDYRIPTCIWILPGLLITPFINKFLAKYYNTHSFLLQAVYNIGAWGGLFVYSFMAINYYFPSENERSVTVEILDTGHLASGSQGCGNPYTEVFIEGREKQLIFPCNYDLEHFTHIDLTLTKGFWGFDVIKDKTTLVK